MRKLFLFMMISADGYFEGRNHDLSWHNAGSQEFSDFVNHQLTTIDTLLLGRRTYELFADFWPTTEGHAADPVTAELMDQLSKVVFSHTLTELNWQNSRLASVDLGDEVTKLKRQTGKDLAVFGSDQLATGLLNAGLLDELRLMVSPVILGQGTSLFSGLTAPAHLSLQGHQTFSDSNVLLTYQRAV